MGEYPHIQFRRHWDLSPKACYELGQCRGIISAISETPLQPEHHRDLLQVSLVKGAQATTAIEGNTLTDEEMARIAGGEQLPPSREYQQTEVQNVLDAMNTVLNEVIEQNAASDISPTLLKRFHEMVGKNLGEHFDASPGRFREDPRVVGRYRCPDHADISKLVEQLCDWLPKEFGHSDNDPFAQSVLEAIVANVYIEWIHPFGDGNGRTGRLVEFYILLRAGNPDIASHILSNFYNATRSEYYKQLAQAGRKGDLTEFIAYAVQGFRDGLLDTLEKVQSYQFRTAWLRYIYDKFAEEKYRKGVFKRRRTLMLELPIGEPLSVGQIVDATPKVARNYASLTGQTLINDLKVLMEMNLLRKKGSQYITNHKALRLQAPRATPNPA